MKAGCPGAHKAPGDKLTPNLEDEATQSYLEHVVDTSFILFLFLWIKKCVWCFTYNENILQAVKNKSNDMPHRQA